MTVGWDTRNEDAEAPPLSAAVAPLCSLGLYGGLGGELIGRPRETATLRDRFAAARHGMASVVVEGEPGIGKTRFLLAVDQEARAQGFVPIAVTADEEIRGPFLLARSIFGCPELLAAAEGTPAQRPLERVTDALFNRDGSGLDSVPGDQRVVRTFDLAALALRALAAQQPLAVLIDDLQWADEDSLRLLRYLVRSEAGRPVLLVLALRPNESAFVNEVVTLLADMDRMGLLRRIKLSRFSQIESSELLQQVLGSPVDLGTASVMHAQAEGVPFILVEQARAYRDAGLVQQIDGVWTLARNAERLMPAAVRTLIQRRAARIPEEARAVLAEAAILGRNFSLRDLAEVRRLLGDEPLEPSDFTTALKPAVDAGLLLEFPDGSAADYAFTHEGVRDYASATLSPARRRAMHGAIVDMLMRDGDPPPASLPLLAQHALASGRGEVAARVSIEAARSALQMNAADEALRLVERAQSVATSPQDRVMLLQLRDDALAVLRRPQRLEALTELAALAEALGDSHLALDVTLRRAAALRLTDEHDLAADLARRVREDAAAAGDPEAELAACIELGQDLLRIELGEGFVQSPSEGDLDGAEEAYLRALALAEQVGDERRVAAASRELGVLSTSRLRAWFIDRVRAGEHLHLLQALNEGAQLDEVLHELPAYPLVVQAFERLQRALEIYERLGDRHGIMATIIVMATTRWAPDIHLTGSPRHIEEIRRLATRVKSLTRESERALADAQMVFGAHVYARTKVFPDVALVKGEETYTSARSLGDRTLEFAACGGVALQHAELGAAEAAERWLTRAAAIASAEPTPLRAFQLPLWRGIASGAAGDVTSMRTHLERAAQIAGEQARPAARCEALAMRALLAAHFGAERGDAELLAEAEGAAREAKAIVPLLPGHVPWGAEADAALATVALARGDAAAAAAAGRAALAALDEAVREDLCLHTVIPAAEGVLAGATDDERAAVKERLQLMLGLVTQRILDEHVRVAWFRSPLGAQLTRLAGAPVPERFDHERAGVALEDGERAILQLLVEGCTNAEIAEHFHESEQLVAQRLASIFAKIGVASRADAKTTALVGNLV